MMELLLAELLDNPWVKIINEYPTQKDREILKRNYLNGNGKVKVDLD